MGHYKSKSGTGSKMLKLPVLLCVCVTDMYGEYVMLAWVTLGECALYQLVHQRLQHHLQHVTRAVLSPHLWMKTKNQCITPLGQILWWRYLHCRSLNFVGRFGCLWFLNNQRCFTNWAHRPVWPIRRPVFGFGNR